MDIILDILSFIWKIISSDSGSNILIFFLFVIQMTIIYGCIVLLLNAKKMQIRKEKSMEFVDSSIDHTYGILIGNYYELARDKFGEDYLESLETQVGEYLFRKALDSRKHEMRKRVRKNGFDLKSPEEWRLYVDHESKEDVTAVTNYLTSMWPRNATIKRDITHNKNMEKIEIIKHELGNLYSEMLNIANKYKMHKFFLWRLTL